MTISYKEVAYMTIHVCRSSLHVPTGGVCWYIAVHLFSVYLDLGKDLLCKTLDSISVECEQKVDLVCF